MEYIEAITEAPFDQDTVQLSNPMVSGQVDSTERSFIVANTVASSLEMIKKNHIIPVFVKDNEPLISQTDFIETTMDVVTDIYSSEQILRPIVRVSHPIKGRIPEAKDKPAKDLLEHEKTLYYERMAFVINIHSIEGEVGGNRLSLTVGGVKAYNHDNLYNKKGADQHFKVFIGFKNTVCTNMCVWTDGFLGDLKIRSVGELRACIRTMVENYNANFHLFNMQQLRNYSLTEKQFTFLIGRCRMYPYLSLYERNRITPLLYGDQQLGAVLKDYFRNKDFCRETNGDIDLWKLYNLFTGSNKTSYIDGFLDRSVNAYRFVEQIRICMEGKEWSWFISPVL